MREITAYPDAIHPLDFDDFMRNVCKDPEPWRVKAPGHWLTCAGLEWGYAPWRIPSGCELDFQGGTLELDYQNIPDSVLKQNVPLHMIPSAIGWAAGKTGEEAWAAVPVGETVKNVTLIANHSKMADRAKALGGSLRISGTVLQGHSASIENVRLVDFGALGGESFPLKIVGAMNGYDRHALSTVHPAHMFDEDRPSSYIRNVDFGGYVPSASNDQVSVCVIEGCITNDRIEDPWAEVGQWRQIFRRLPYIEHPRGIASGDNKCQLATIHQAQGGRISSPFCRGFHAGVYGDYYTTFDLTVEAGDLEALRPVAQILSETGSGAEQFASSGLTVRSSWLRVLPTESDLHGGVTLLGLNQGGQRWLSNVTLDDNDFVMVGTPGAANVAVRARGVDGLKVLPSNRFHGFRQLYAIDPDCTGVELPPAPASKKGCNWLRRLGRA